MEMKKNVTKKRAIKNRVVPVLIFTITALFLGACGKSKGTGNAAAANALATPKETAEFVMENLKSLDLKAFNEYTDNYVETYTNMIGIPTSVEYRIFNELLQPSLKKGWKYEWNYRLTEKILEQLSWEIKDVREKKGQAEIDMEITNINMRDAIGNYEISVRENMLESEGTGLGRLFMDISAMVFDPEVLITMIDALDEDDISTIEVTVLAYQENGQWKLHVSDEFINAFLGNINAEGYEEDMEQRIMQLEYQYEEKLDDWADRFSDRVEEMFP